MLCRRTPASVSTWLRTPVGGQSVCARASFTAEELGGFNMYIYLPVVCCPGCVSVGDMVSCCVLILPSPSPTVHEALPGYMWYTRVSHRFKRTVSAMYERGCVHAEPITINPYHIIRRCWQKCRLSPNSMIFILWNLTGSGQAMKNEWDED